MSPRRSRIRAASEDMRKLGVTLMIAGIVGSAFKNQVPVEVAFIGGLLGLTLHLVSDISYTLIDPRISFDARKV